MVAEHCRGAAGEDRGHWAGEGRVDGAHAVDASVQRLELPAPHPVSDRVARNAESRELLDGDDPVLPGCQCRYAFVN